MQKQVCRFTTKNFCYIATRKKEGENWSVIFGSDIMVPRKWILITKPEEFLAPIPENFELLSESEIEELFYEVL